MMRSIKTSPRSVHPLTLILATVATVVTLALYEMRPRLTAGELSSLDMAPSAAPLPSPDAAVSDSTKADGKAVVKGGLAPAIQQAMQEELQLLENSESKVCVHTDYSATFLRQERVNGELRKPEHIELKVRCKPFSVYMRWPETKREVLYVDGRNDGDLMVREGGWKGTLGLLKLAPGGALAMAECRYPMTQVGLERLADRLIQYRKRDLGLSHGLTCQLEPAEFEGRDCDRYTIEYTDRKLEPVYRLSITYIDRELHVPICVKNFGWVADESIPADDDSRLIEYYVYRDIKFDQGLTDSDFDVNNAAYAFRK